MTSANLLYWPCRSQLPYTCIVFDQDQLEKTSKVLKFLQESYRLSLKLLFCVFYSCFKNQLINYKSLITGKKELPY